MRDHERREHLSVDEGRVVADLLSDGDDATTRVMIDVGAHHGSTLSPLALRGWMIHAFEPDPTNRAFLVDRFRDQTNIRIDPRAVTDVGGQNLAFFQSPLSTGISSLYPFHSTHEEIATVYTTTLTEYCAEQDLGYVDYLKIDTEGYDLFVLRGFDWSFRPTSILCEFEDRKTLPLGYSVHDMAGFLVDRGYQVWVSEWHPVVAYGRSHDWRRIGRYPCALDDPGAWGNIMAFSEPVDELLLMEAVKRRTIAGS